MSQEISGRGDPVRVLELAWNGMPAPKRGPKPKRELSEVLEAAIAIADAEGLEAVSTRRVAVALGISPMSFYTYVPGINELLDLMLETIHGELEPPQGNGWREKLQHLARQLWALLLRHPWALELATHRPVMGPHTTMAYEMGLACIDGLGLDEIEMDMALTLVFDYVRGAVRGAAMEQYVFRATGLTDDEWWVRVAPVLEEVVDWSQYPVASRVGPVAGAEFGAHAPKRAFAFGLKCVLDGLEFAIANKSSSSRREPGGRKRT